MSQRESSNVPSRTVEASLPALPRLTSTVVVTLLFGVFGLIPAAVNAGNANRAGVSGARYWKAFGWSMIAYVAASAVVTVAILVAVNRAVNNLDNGLSDGAAGGAAGAAPAPAPSATVVPEDIGSTFALGVCYSEPGAQGYGDLGLAAAAEQLVPVECSSPHHAEIIMVGDCDYIPNSVEAAINSSYAGTDEFARDSGLVRNMSVDYDGTTYCAAGAEDAANAPGSSYDILTGSILDGSVQTVDGLR